MENQAPEPAGKLSSIVLTRSLVGGILMGLANLVPGISGGTMLVASGVYPRFINAIAELTVFKFRLPSLAVLGVVVAAAGTGILLLAGTVKGLVVDHRWIMYSLFIGLTLGGIPVIRRMLKPAGRAGWIGGFIAFAGMALLAILQARGAGAGAAAASGKFMLFAAGIAGAGAMILPGVSGGYILLLMGQYVPILSAIDNLKLGLKAMDLARIMDVGIKVCLPVGLGMIVGIVAVSNLLKMLLRRYEKATLGALMGLLVGAVVGLWPFQEGMRPKTGDTIKGVVVTEANMAEIAPEDWPTAYFRPTGGQVATSALVVIAGFLVTLGVSRFGGEGKEGA